MPTSPPRRGRLSRLPFVALGALALGPTIASAQIGRAGTDLARPMTWAITNARIVPVSGPVIPQGTVVIRNGLIATVGPADRAVPPADARRIDGTGLTVYPGLIDAYSTLGVPAPRNTGAGRGGPGGGTGGAAALVAQQSASADAARSRYPEGLRPEDNVSELLDLDADAFALARGAGVTAALSAPRSGILAGHSALITLGQGTPQDVIVRSPVALHVGFTPLRGAYPGSLLGVFASLRQMLYDARRYGDLQAAYARNPRGMTRPENDPSLASLLPALARDVPVMLQASSQREIERALDLAKEFNLRAVIVGGADAHKVAARLKAENVPVIASLNFPRARESSPDADPEPLRLLKERAEAPRNAARLAEAGVRFAFTGSGLQNASEFLTGVRRTTEAGLGRDRALRALTLDAAELLGVGDRLGSIEVGKIANLTVVRGDLFESGAAIAHVFVDGRPLEARATPAGGRGGSAANAEGRAAGQWLLTVTLEGQEKQVTLELQQDGETLRGSIQGGLGTSQIANGSIGANGEFKFTASITTSETDEATFAGTLTGAAMRGSVTVVGHNPGTFTGQRAAGRRGRTP
jgi:imidazolonepropionase-like amidohydrolase